MSFQRSKIGADAAAGLQTQNIYQALGAFLEKEKSSLHGKQADIVQTISDEIAKLPENKMQLDSKKLERELESTKDKMKYILTCLFHLAVEHQQVSIVKNIYNYSMHIMHSLNPFSPHEYTALHTLCLNENENVPLANFLLQAGCLVSVVEKEKKLTPGEFAEAKHCKKYAKMFSLYSSVYGNPKNQDDSRQQATLKPLRGS